MSSPDDRSPVSTQSRGDDVAILSEAYDRLSTPVALVDEELQLLFANAVMQRLSGAELPSRLYGFLADPYGISRHTPQMIRSSNFALRGVALREPWQRYEIHVHHPQGRPGILVAELQPRSDELVSFAAKGDEIRGQRARGHLGRMQEEITKANMELQQFAYVASHDLQAPVRGIEGFLKLLLRTAGDRLDDTSTELVGNALHNSRHMQRLIQDLLTFSRLATDAREHRPVDLGEVLATLRQSTAARLAVLNGVLEISSELPMVAGDREQLEVLFGELLANALTFRGSRVPHISVTAKEQDEHWVIDIADNGIGIEPRHQDSIFQIFRKLHPERDTPGTGIGLALCSRIVANHQGMVWLSSLPGVGTTFSISLPKITGTAAG